MCFAQASAILFFAVGRSVLVNGIFENCLPVLRSVKLILASSRECHNVIGDPVSERELDVQWEILERPQLEHVKCRTVFVVGMCRSIKPGMSDIVTECQHRCPPSPFIPESNG